MFLSFQSLNILIELFIVSSDEKLNSTPSTIINGWFDKVSDDIPLIFIFEGAPEVLLTLVIDRPETFPLNELNDCD